EVACTVLLLGCAIAGVLLLRRAPKAGFPLAAWAFAVATPLVLANAFHLYCGDPYLAPAFVFLLVAEGFEELFYAFGGLVAAPVFLIAVLSMTARSWLLGR